MRRVVACVVVVLLGFAGGIGPSFALEADPKFVRVTAGSDHSLGLTDDGTVYAWGRNTFGQLGLGHTADRLNPTLVSGLPDIVEIGTGGHYSMALTSTGEVYAWGYDDHGQLGQGSTANDSLIPLVVPSLPSIKMIAAGYTSALALTNAGTVYAWGDNENGQLGIGNTIDQPAPVAVAGLTGVTAIVASSSHSLALTDAGTVYAWGNNDFGQLGIGNTGSKLTPVPVAGLTDIAAVAVGGFLSLALTNAGTVYAWGDNTYGQVGNGNRDAQLTPVPVNGLTDVNAIAAGEHHSLALTNAGAVYAWGYNGDGQLGLGHNTSVNVPTVVPEISGVNSINEGNAAYSSFVVLDTGQLLGTGFNAYGQLGNGTTDDTNTFTGVVLGQVSGTVTITGSGLVGQQLTATPSNWPTATDYTSYQWSSSGTPLATGTTFTPDATLIGTTIELAITGEILNWAPGTATDSITISPHGLTLSADRTDITEGDTITLTVTALDAGNTSVGDVTDRAIITASHPTTVIAGNKATLHAPTTHTLTAKIGATTTTLDITVNSATTSQPGTSTTSSPLGIATTGSTPWILLTLGLILLAGGITLAALRHTHHTTD